MKHLFLIFAAVLLSFSAFSRNNNDDLRTARINSNFLLDLINQRYVDQVELMPLVERGTIEILRQLDPHSQFIPARDVQRANEPLQGAFYGIGVTFQIFNDTIIVMEAVSGGPSERLGIQAGDRIIAIDGINATGDSARNDFVFRNLRGPRGTVVVVEILRNGEVREFRIVRDRIPIHTVEVFFMENENTGYISVDRFSRRTAAEFRAALQSLIQQGAENIILDLRGNSGGYMDQAIEMANEFLEGDLLIVYMEGARQPRQNNVSTRGGMFRRGRLVVLVDERSASASEIVSGAIQDHDRGIIVGRRTFGKGLVQRPFVVPGDNSEIRLTIARYYTPSGRSIQKPFVDGFEQYFEDLMNRFAHGELVHPDSIMLPDSLRFFTSGGRAVYGGGGIVPDIFTPIDTNRASDFFVDVRRTGVLNNFIVAYLDRERQNLMEKFPTFEDFYNNFQMEGQFTEEFERFAEEAGVRRSSIRAQTANMFLNRMLVEMRDNIALTNSETYRDYIESILWSEEKMRDFLMNLADEEDATQRRLQESSDQFIFMNLKALLARNLYGARYFFQTMRSVDPAYQRALKVIQDDSLFRQLGISY
ncbi:MAG: S41 family peptidase [Bacteroidales bacterium]|nr:S41 family peptidase [Bacteroidales bacterium]